MAASAADYYGSSYTDPDAFRRRLAMTLAGNAFDTSPKQSWAQGAAQLAQALIAGSIIGEDRNAFDTSRTHTASAMATMLGGQAPGGSPAASTSSEDTPAPAPLRPVTPNRVYSQDEVNPIDAQILTPKQLAYGVNAPAAFAPVIGKAAIENDLPPALLTAQIKQESGFNPNAVSPAGATGISQFMPGTARDFGINPRDPNQAIPAQAQYLRQNIDKFGGSVENGLAAYNWGPGKVQQWLANGGDPSKLPAETQNYIRSISASAQSPQSGGMQVASADAGFVPGGQSQQKPQGQQVAQAGPDARTQAAMSIVMDRYADPAAKSMAANYLGQTLLPKYKMQITPNGDVVRMNDSAGSADIVLQTPVKPTHGVISKNQFGVEQYGWTDPQRMKTIPDQPQGVAPQQAGDPTITGKAFLDTIDKPTAEQVQAIAEGRMQPPSSFALKTPYWQQMMNYVGQYEPGFDLTQWNQRVATRKEFNAGGPSSPAGQLTAGRQAIQHLAETADAAETMKSQPGALNAVAGMNIPFVSKGAAALNNSAVQGTESGAPLAAFNTARNHFSEEVTKFYAGSPGSEAERDRALTNLDAAKSWPELQAAIKSETHLMQGKVNALQTRWRQGMGPNAPDFQIIDPKTQEALDRIAAKEPTLPGAAPTSTAPQQQQSQPQQTPGAPPGAVEFLRANPQAAAQFDAKYGQGASARVLGR